MQNPARRTVRTGLATVVVALGALSASFAAVGTASAAPAEAAANTVPIQLCDSSNNWDFALRFDQNTSSVFFPNRCGDVNVPRGQAYRIEEFNPATRQHVVLPEVRHAGDTCARPAFVLSGGDNAHPAQVAGHCR